MDQEQNNQSGNDESGVAGSPTSKSNGTGNTVIVAAAIVIVLAIVAWYVIGQDAVAPSVTTEQVVTETTPTPVVDTEMETLGKQAATDDVTSIEADLGATDLNSLGDINQI